jgi:hypothetical protein
MFRKTVIITIATSLVFGASLHAQDYREGYVITNDGDSLVGFVAYRAANKNFASCSFKSSRKASEVKYSPTEIKRYGFFGDKRYESIILPNSGESKVKVFAKVLSDAPLKLYGYRNQFLIQKDSLVFLPPPAERLVDVKEGDPSKVVDPKEKMTVSRSGYGQMMKDRRYIGILNHFIEDCKLSATRTAYTETALTKLVNNYNRCKGASIVVHNTKPAFHVSPKIFGGAINSQLRVNDLPKNAFGSSRNLFFGGGVDISSPRLFDRSHLSLEFIYTKIFYQGYTEGPSSGDVLRKDIYVDISYYKIPIAFKYNFGRANNSSYMKIGFAVFVNHTPKIRTFEERQAPNKVIYSNEYEGGFSVRTPKSLWLGVGYEKSIARRCTLFAEIRAEKNSGFIGSIFTGYSSALETDLVVGLKL